MVVERVQGFRVCQTPAFCPPPQDPAFLFDDPAYTAHGNLFWPDFWTDM